MAVPCMGEQTVFNNERKRDLLIPSTLLIARDVFKYNLRRMKKMKATTHVGIKSHMLIKARTMTMPTTANPICKQINTYFVRNLKTITAI